jgi:DNA-binding SARP family transcriptional activator
MLSILLLGPTKITLDSSGDTAPLSFRTNKVQALLCYLAVEALRQPGLGFRREALMALLWPDMPLKSAQDNLRQTLYQLRKAVPTTGSHGLMLSDRLTIQMHPAADYELDVAQFQNLLQEKPDQLALEKAAALYRGDFLANFFLSDSDDFDAWAADWRLELRTQVLAALNKLTNSLIEQGQYEKAESYARQQLDIDNLRESAHRQLMTALANNGRRAEALQHYHTCRQILREELQVEPSAETTALNEKIRSGEDEKTRSHPPPIPTAFLQRLHNLPAPTTSFVGRQQELAEIISQLSDPTCRLLTLLGPGGIGKTRLALQVASTLTQFDLPIFPDGIFLVSLAAVPTMDHLVPAIADAVNFSFSGNRDPQQQLLAYLKPKKFLLILDNLEHLAAESALLVDFLTAVPGLTFLTTSRIRLNLYEEWHFELTGLALPLEQETANLANHTALQLFVQRARQVGRTDFDESQLAIIAQICYFLAGLPLGIELACSRGFPSGP